MALGHVQHVPPRASVSLRSALISHSGGDMMAAQVARGSRGQLGPSSVTGPVPLPRYASTEYLPHLGI